MKNLNLSLEDFCKLLEKKTKCSNEEINKVLKSLIEIMQKNLKID